MLCLSSVQAVSKQCLSSVVTLLEQCSLHVQTFNCYLLVKLLHCVNKLLYFVLVIFFIGGLVW